MIALRYSASKADVQLERKLRYEFAKLRAKDQLRSLYRNHYAKSVAGQTTTVLTVQTVAGHSVLTSETYTPTPIGEKRVGVQAEPQHDAQKRQRRTGNLVEGVPQTPMSSQTQNIHATSPDTAIDRCDDAALKASPHGTARSLTRQATQEEVGVSVKAHEDLVSEVARLRESFTHMQTVLDQSVNERKQLRDSLDQVQLDQLHEQMNRLGSIDSVQKRL
uniref:Uncharacterized protein n=1 Tax=Hyaloperonospora arabidopsidis (strain Emoy2) TaxID=559515 RepID=M4BUG1_HYAAE